MTLAILCSGQGLQHSRMFSLTSSAPTAAPVFAHAAQLFGGWDPREMVRAAPAEVLHRNRIAQIICASQALAAAAALRNLWPNRILLAGYSVGEVAAWGIAQILDETTTLDLVAVRAELMDAASARGDGLLSLRGLSRSTVEDLCNRYSAAIAIINPNEAFVLGGYGGALDALAVEAMTRGAAGVARIAVNVAAHTARLAPASSGFLAALERAPAVGRMHTGVRLFSGIDGTVVLDPKVGKNKLAEQICRTVQWEACLHGCVEAGASAFLELGPGAALSNMCSRTFPHIPSRSLEDFRTIEGAASWLTRYGAGARDILV
jgi:[acyl-carrier-protein] S-malonyltransferase